MDDDDDDDLPDLKGLLAALGSFAKAANSLPTGDDFDFEASFPEFQTALQAAQESVIALLQSSGVQATHKEDGRNGGSRSSSRSNQLPTPFLLPGDRLDDPQVWDDCADACDALLEQAQAYLATTDDTRATSAATTTTESLQQWSTAARTVGARKLSTMAAATLHDLPKPQDSFVVRPDNSRTTPFVPTMTEKPHARVPLDLTVRLPGHGHGTRLGDLRQQQQGRPRTNNAGVPHDDTTVVAPTHHCPHVYETEIRSLVFRPEQFLPPDSAAPAKVDANETTELTATWIDTEDALQQLAATLVQHDTYGSTLAVDLEAHSYHSFAGFVCLMQVSYETTTTNKDTTINTEPHNFLIDTLALRHVLHQHLATVFANPAIVKVFHGADSDIAWLQRDFSIYVVNLFDTGRAARALAYPSAGYAHLLHRVCGIAADKSHQLADWRQRPLPDAMRQYAIQDTHYLLTVFRHVQWDLQQQQQQQRTSDTAVSIRSVWDDSRTVSLIRYSPEPFFPDGYTRLLRRNPARHPNRNHNRIKPPPDHVQRASVRALWDWRDATARITDESVSSVCPNAQLLRIAMTASSSVLTVSQLQGLLHPMPPLVRRYGAEICALLQRAVAVAADEVEVGTGEKNDSSGMTDSTVNTQNITTVSSKKKTVVRVDDTAVGTPSSAFFKPAVGVAEPKRRGIMSPVLGTEALYRQAGWMTPLDIFDGDAASKEGSAMVVVETTSGEEDEGGGGGESSTTELLKPKKLLSVHVSNKDYTSKEYSSHSLELGKASGGGRGRTVDGLGSVRAAMEDSQGTAVTQKVLDDQVKEARATSARINHQTGEKIVPTVLRLVATKGIDAEEDMAEDDEEAENDQTELKEQPKGAADMDEEFVIPRSIREIYMISNRNRRNKKTGSPTPERGVTPTSERERQDLVRAEAILKERGAAVAGYFDDAGSGGVNPGKRPRTRSGRESEESVPDPSAKIVSRADDMAFMKDIGWLGPNEDANGILDPRGVHRGNDAAVSSSDPVAVEDTASNPFFSGVSPTNQATAQTTKSRKGGQKGKQRTRQQERPDKSDSRSHSYRKR